MLDASKGLPSFVSPAVLIEAFAEGIKPHEAVSVSEAAERHVRLDNSPGYQGPWRNSQTPYLVEPMNRATARDVDELYIIGPSQWGKTQIPLNVIAHAIKYRPAAALLIQPTKDLAIDFSERRIELGLLDTSPDLRAELGGDVSDDKRLAKTFRNGMMLTIAWPVAGQLASRPVPMVIIDERDRLPDNIGKEGDPVALGRNRKKTFGRHGILICVSSPSRSTYTGILPLYYTGDQNIWFWPCQECGEYWSPGFDQDRRPLTPEDAGFELDFPREASAEEAAAATRLLCPVCGFPHRESHKAAMNAAGTWLAKGCELDRDGRITGERPRTRVASYWGSGLISPFMPWSDIARNYINARLELEREGLENLLQVLYNTDLGIPYKSEAERKRLTPEEIKDRAETGYRLGEVPEGVLYLTAAVDIQADRFEVGVKGWSGDGESWWVDRFAIRQLGDGRTDIDPASVAEHWLVLLDQVIRRAYPLRARPGRCLMVAKTAIDTGGVEGVTDLAYDFYRTAIKTVPRRAVMLIKGHNVKTAPALPANPTYEGAAAKDRKKLEAVPLYVIGVSNLKDALVNRLARTEPGPGYQHFPTDFPDRGFRELAGEVKEGGVWVRKGANETFDLDCYATAARLLLRPHKVNWTSPPLWATDMPIPGGAAEAADGDANGVRTAAPIVIAEQPAPRRARRGNMLKRRDHGAH